MGGMQPQPVDNFGFGDDGNNDGEPEADWATAGMFDAPAASLPLDFAKPEMVDVLQQNQPGQKGKAGFKIRGHFFIENQTITLGLEVTNGSGESLV